MKSTEKTKKTKKVEHTEAIRKPMTKGDLKKYEAEIKEYGRLITNIGIVLRCFIKHKHDSKKTREFLEEKYGKEKAKLLIDQYNGAFPNDNGKI